MSGYKLILKIRDLEAALDKLGFMLCHAEHYYREGDMVAIKPKDNDSLPIYARDAKLFVGTLEELEPWVQGVQWARKYDSILFGKTYEAKRERKEQDYRNEQLANLLKQ